MAYGIRIRSEGYAQRILSRALAVWIGPSFSRYNPDRDLPITIGLSCEKRNVPMARYLPIGIDEFDELRTLPSGLYVDKTELVAALAADLLGHTPQLFLARPRRFGKTLLISTLQALFQGEQALFAGTWLGQNGHWDWRGQRYPVLRLDMDLRDVHSRSDLEAHLASRLARKARQAGVAVDRAQRPAPLLEELIEALYAKHGRRLVVLVDEYDTPITENMDRPDALDDIQSVMRAVYGTFKGSRRYLRCAFMTGITRIALAGLFSGANHFKDISFAPQFNALLGFTQDEVWNTPDLAADCAQSAARLDCAPEEFAELLRGYYNGYQFSAKDEAVYNPYSLALCLETLRGGGADNARWRKDHLPNGWVQSGTPALLFRLWQTGRFATDLAADDEANADALSALQKTELDIACPDRDALLYHAGYLTLTPSLALDFPNQEVRLAFRNSVARWQRGAVRAWHEAERAAGHPGGSLIRDALRAGDAPALQAHIHHLMQQFPYPGRALPAQAKSIYNYEMHYRGILFSVLWALGLPIQIEGATARGRADIVIQEDHQIYVLECKVNASAAAALRQVWDKGYVDPYCLLGKPVIAFGLNFDTRLRTITDVAKHELGVYDLGTQCWRAEPLGNRCTLTQLSQMSDNRREAIIYGDTAS